MREVIKLNRKGPRHRAKRYNMASDENISAIAKHPDCLVKDSKKVKQVIMAIHNGIRDTIVNTRDGIELPEQLGYMFLGTCQPKVRKNVDFSTTDHYLKVIQHRNWESLLQIISLRTQPMNVSRPAKQSDGWYFEFEVEAQGVLSSGFDSDDLAGLRSDCEGVPMVTGLDEATAIASTLHAEGDNANIWFTSVNT